MQSWWLSFAPTCPPAQYVVPVPPVFCSTFLWLPSEKKKMKGVLAARVSTSSTCTFTPAVKLAFALSKPPLSSVLAYPQRSNVPPFKSTQSPHQQPSTCLKQLYFKFTIQLAQPMQKKNWIAFCNIIMIYKNNTPEDILRFANYETQRPANYVVLLYL